MNVSPLVLKSKLSLGLWGETLVFKGACDLLFVKKTNQDS